MTLTTFWVLIKSLAIADRLLNFFDQKSCKVAITVLRDKSGQPVVKTSLHQDQESTTPTSQVQQLMRALWRGLAREQGFPVWALLRGNQCGNFCHDSSLYDSRLELERDFVAHPEISAKPLSTFTPISCEWRGDSLSDIYGIGSMVRSRKSLVSIS